MIRIGVAGWDYPDWRGVVYPAPAPRGFDRLAFLAGLVDAIEVNSTFYRPVAPPRAASWARRTEHRPSLRFSAKAHRSWTHEDRAPTPDELDRTLEGLAPLREADRLGALLVQFPQRFHRTPASWERLESLAERLRDWPAVIEVRHASWNREDAVEAFRRLGLGWCVVDQPRVGRSTAAGVARVTSPVAYLRLHGRNATNWFREDAGRDARYDYLYSTPEIEALAETARRLAEGCEELFVIQNNHFRGQAVVNALQMKHAMSGEKPAAPSHLVDAYPELAERTTSPQPRLF